MPPVSLCVPGPLSKADSVFLPARRNPSTALPFIKTRMRARIKQLPAPRPARPAPPRPASARPARFTPPHPAPARLTPFFRPSVYIEDMNTQNPVADVEPKWEELEVGRGLELTTVEPAGLNKTAAVI